MDEYIQFHTLRIAGINSHEYTTTLATILKTMKRILIISTLLGLIISINSHGQETKKKRVQKENFIEEYYILKDNKNIKHGQYVKFKKYILDQRIPIEFGFFENDKRVGEWYFFYSTGSLESFGKYHADEKQGLWKEYYKHVNKNESITSLLNGHSDVVVDENGSISIEQNDSLMSAMGIYDSGKKMGTWNYYDGNGTLIHVFNHSTDKMIFSSVSDSTNQKCPFLGGIDRFYSLYFKNKETIEFNNELSDIKLILKLEFKEGGLIVEKVGSTGTEKTDLELEHLIQAFPNDWIPSYFDNPVFLTLERKNDHNKLIIIASFN